MSMILCLETWAVLLQICLVLILQMSSMSADSFEKTVLAAKNGKTRTWHPQKRQ